MWNNDLREFFGYPPNTTDIETTPYDIRLPFEQNYADDIDMDVLKEEGPFNIKIDPEEKNKTMNLPCFSDDRCVFPGQVLAIITYNEDHGKFFLDAFERDRDVAFFPYSNKFKSGRLRGVLLKLFSLGQSGTHFHVKFLALKMIRTVKPITLLEIPVDEMFNLHTLGNHDVIIEIENLELITRKLEANCSIEEWPRAATRFWKDNRWSDMCQKIREHLKTIGLPEDDVKKAMAQDPAFLSYYFIECIVSTFDEKVDLFNSPTIESRVYTALQMQKHYKGLTCKECGTNIQFVEPILVSIAGVSPDFTNKGGFHHRGLCLKSSYTQHHYQTGDSWFPKYCWSVYNCNQCSNHLGWSFCNHACVSPLIFMCVSMKNVAIKRYIPHNDKIVWCT